MELLHNYLPKDLINIVDEYSKDRTNYDKVLKEFETTIISISFDYDFDFDFDMICKGSSTHCPCDDASTYIEMRTWTPYCYEGFMSFLNLINKNDNKLINNQFKKRLFKNIKN